MTMRSTLERASSITRPALWSLSRYESNGKAVDYPISYDDFERDTAWATEVLRRYAIGQGSFVLFNSAGFEAAWFEPFLEAVKRLGGVQAFAEKWAWDANRTEMMARRLPLTMVFGITDEVVDGLARIAPVAERLNSIPHLLARPEAAGLLRDQGLSAGTCVLLGPALAVECPERQGAHIDPGEWRLGAAGKTVGVSTVGPRAHQVRDQPSGVSGDVVDEPCRCGLPGPRLKLR
jgi:hypothetical protein